MTDVTTGAGLADIQVTSNATTAPVEQKSTETTAPITRREQRFAELESKPQETVVADTKPVEPAKALPTEADKANDTAREALKEKMRADAAEAKTRKHGVNPFRINPMILKPFLRLMLNGLNRRAKKGLLSASLRKKLHKPQKNCVLMWRQGITRPALSLRIMMRS